jgi:hypothetical protein
MTTRTAAPGRPAPAPRAPARRPALVAAPAHAALLAVRQQAGNASLARALAARRLAHATLQRERCPDGTAWYSGRRAAVAGSIAGTTGMPLSPDTAHVLACAFCRAFVRSWTGGEDAGARHERYTRLFERWVHTFHSRSPGTARRQLYTEEAYWLPADPVAFARRTGLGNRNAHVIDQAFAARLAPLPELAPAGWLPSVAVPARRRSLPSELIRRSALYAALALRPAGCPLKGRMRVLDVTTNEMIGGGTRHTVADAKFAYPFGGHDRWGPGQAQDQLTIHGVLSGGAAARAVPLLTWNACCCEDGLLEAAINRQRRLELQRTGAKRPSPYRAAAMIDQAYDARLGTAKRLRAN